MDIRDQKHNHDELVAFGWRVVHQSLRSEQLEKSGLFYIHPKTLAEIDALRCGGQTGKASKLEVKARRNADYFDALRVCLKKRSAKPLIEFRRKSKEPATYFDLLIKALIVLG